MEDRIEEIKFHLSAAEGPDRQAGIHMWEAARLIWEEVDSGTSRRELAREIGKSHTHVRYMYNCWDLVGRKTDGDLPNFNEVYHSSEVRGENEDTEPSERKRGREPEDHSAHGLVMTITGALGELTGNPAFWPLMTDEDWALISEVPAVIDALMRDSGR